MSTYFLIQCTTKPLRLPFIKGIPNFNIESYYNTGRIKRYVLFDYRPQPVMVGWLTELEPGVLRLEFLTFDLIHKYPKI